MKSTFTDEQIKQIQEIRKHWRRNAFRSGLLNEEEKRVVTEAMEGLYSISGKNKPEVVFVSSPFVGAVVAGVIASFKLRLTEIKYDFYVESHCGSFLPRELPPIHNELMANVDDTVSLVLAPLPHGHLVMRGGARDSVVLDDPEFSKHVVDSVLESTGSYPLGSGHSNVLGMLCSLVLEDSMRLCIEGSYKIHNGGNRWSDYISIVDMYDAVLGFDLDKKEAFLNYKKAAIAGDRWMLDGYCVVSHPPIKMSFDSRMNFHCTDGPAVEWADGSKIYSYHGVGCPADIIENKKSITVERIKKQRNLEIRRVMIELYGTDQYLKDTGAVVVDVDSLTLTGSASRALIKDDQGSRWLIGSDGSSKRVYYIDVPIGSDSCRKAHEDISGFSEDRMIAES